MCIEVHKWVILRCNYPCLLPTESIRWKTRVETSVGLGLRGKTFFTNCLCYALKPAFSVCWELQGNYLLLRKMSKIKKGEAYPFWTLLLGDQGRWRFLRHIQKLYRQQKRIQNIQGHLLSLRSLSFTGAQDQGSRYIESHRAKRGTCFF